MHAGAEKGIFQRARQLRDNATHAEDVLWGYLKTKPMGLKFRRQHPYSVYILDFYCHKLKLVIEVDGKIHLDKAVKTNDQLRQSLLEEDGMSVLRFTNELVLTKLEEVILAIEKHLKNGIN